MKEKKRQTVLAEETLPTPIKEKETRWLKRDASLLHHKGLQVGLQPETLADRLLETHALPASSVRVYKGLQGLQGFTMVAYSPRLWLMAA
eukprot:133110-Pelagomonas_calceolata.AAC.2